MIENDKLIPWLEKALDLSYRRNAILSSNIANVDTPNFTPKDLDFQESLKNALKSTQTTPDDFLEPSEIARSDAEPGLDENGVNLDKEMVRLGVNRTFFRMATEITQRRMAMVRYAINEGGQA